MIADVATPTCFKDAIPAMLALGVVTAQLTVICVWGTLVRGTFWIRLPRTLLLLLLSWCGFAWGITIENGKPDTQAMLSTAVLWMFGFITSFVPLKIAALCFRWKIVQYSTGDQKADRNSNYTTGDIMIGTMLLALSMGIGRAILPDEEISFTRALQASALNQPELLFAITMYGIVSLLVKLPCIWISLGEKTEKIKSRIILWIVYCFVLAIIEIGLLIAVLGNPGSGSGEFFAGMIISHQIMGVIMLGICLALHGLGYQLERSLSRQAKHEMEDKFHATTSLPESGSV
ncbi:hypothetical protein SH528x_003174 [Novipirellula sp. SH528]|uniref:hypothetical protein n=1 Tax=Novipirellula sp. SH528 TaxID=3454466 RepID=UPI003FA01D79